MKATKSKRNGTALATRKVTPKDDAPVPVEAEIKSSPVSETALVRRIEERSVTDVIEQSKKIQDLMQKALKEGQHYGIIPGTKKQSLLKPGAEKINFLFRIGTGDLEVTRTDFPEGHREITIKTPMVHIPTGTAIAYGVGSCSTMESKYRYRQAARICPKCKKETIIKGKEEYGGGWLCYVKKGGCGTKFKDNDETITGQEVGQVENKDIADTYNTVLKVAAKRSYVDGTIKASAASDFFTQDVEDMQDLEGNGAKGNGEPVYDVGPSEPTPAKPVDEKANALADLRDVFAKMRASKLFTDAELAEKAASVEATKENGNQMIDLQGIWIDALNARKRAEGKA